MANQIKLVSISELLGYDFLIPSYQRGYRWSKQQVEDLLYDIHGFAIKKNKSEKEFYCLQPIVVKKQHWEQKDQTIQGWEVVDGQQRLTTIRILLYYLIKMHLRGATLNEEYGKDLFSLVYETRPNSTCFLDHIDEEDAGDDIDFYHMSNAYQVIKEWFSTKEKQRDVREAMISTLVHDRYDQEPEGIVEVIWYEIAPGQNPIDTFIRINLGKIPLTNAELIKALFLRERNFDKNELGKLRQMEIAGEWDSIENALQDEDFWWFLNKEKNTVSSRIEFIFDLMCMLAKRDDRTLEAKIGTDKFATFRYFNLKFEKTYLFDQLKADWDRVKDYFMSFEEWFSDPVWYHYIGFLIYCGEDIVSIYELTKNETTKDQITVGLIEKIKSFLSTVKWAIADRNSHLDLAHPRNNAMIKRVLLLFNLAPIIEQSKSKTLIYKFPFKSFKSGHWDIEHIDAYNTRKMKVRKDQIAWLEFAKLDLDWILKNDLVLTQVEDFTLNPNSQYNFEDMLARITELSGEKLDEEESDELKNNIGNLTLLNAHLNRSYGNALFPTKRRKIIEYDAVGDFMPMNTRNVFLKYYDLQGTSRTRWTRSDMEEYRENIASALKGFLPPRPTLKPSSL